MLLGYSTFAPLPLLPPYQIGSCGNPCLGNAFSTPPLSSVMALKKPSLKSAYTSMELGTLSACTSSTPPSGVKKVLVPVGFGSEEMEAVVVVDVLRRAGAEVLVASVESFLEIEAAGGSRIVADSSISECSNEIFDLIVLPGGMPGASRLRDSDVLRQITTKHVEEQKLYAAICAAPAVTLLPWDLLRRKQMTGHPAFMDKLPTFWAVKSNVHVSKELTTSRGPGTCFEFAISLVEQLLGDSIAEKLTQDLLMDDDKDESKTVEYNATEWLFNHLPRVLVPVGNGSQEAEVVAIADILRRAKVEVVIASVEDSLLIRASQGIKIVADRSISDAANSTYDAIILPGEDAGVHHLAQCTALRKLLREQNRSGRIIGGVSSSPAMLQREGFLQNEKSTAHPAVTSDPNGRVNDAAVVVDGKVITGKGIARTPDFALAMVSKFFGDERAGSVAEGIVFDYRKRRLIT